jgi:hypothetical protein
MLASYITILGRAGWSLLNLKFKPVYPGSEVRPLISRLVGFFIQTMLIIET